MKYAPAGSEKACRGCGRVKPMGEFPRRTGGGGAMRDSQCRACCQKRSRANRIRRSTGMGPAEWAAFVRDHGGRCYYCDVPFSESEPATADHLVARSQGGASDRSNIVPACHRCNSSKCARPFVPRLIGPRGEKLDWREALALEKRRKGVE